MRVKTTLGEDVPIIDPLAVESFFAARAEKAKVIGSLRAVIYQDKHPDLAERRDTAEKTLLLPKLRLNARSRVLDVGCGTGRWTGVIAPRVQTYHGTDFSAGLVARARAEYGLANNVRYSVLRSSALSLEALGESREFDTIILLGLLIYLNDGEVFETLSRIATVAAPDCRLLIGEPVATDERLTIKEHFSDDLEQVYNAIYRAECELLKMFADTVGKTGFKLVDSGCVYEHFDLNNRVDTVKKWYLLERNESY